MKFLVIMLALATFAGYQAFVLKDEPQSELERLNDEIQEYLRNSEKEFQKQFDPFLRTKEFRDLLYQFLGMFGKIQNQFDELPSEVKQVIHLAISIPVEVAEKVYDDLQQMKRKLEPTRQQMHELLKSRLAIYADPVLERLETVIDVLRQRIKELHKKLNEQLPEQLEKAGAQLLSYTETASSQWQASQTYLQPVVNQTEEYFRNAMESISKDLKPYIDPLLEAAPEHVKALRAWTHTPLFPQEH